MASRADRCGDSAQSAGASCVYDSASAPGLRPLRSPVLPEPPRTVPEMLEVLERSDDSALIGLHESTWFDAKSSAYQLDNPKQVWELAKDVSAMANVAGGVILIGATAERSTGSLVEFVTAVEPIPTERLMMADRVHALLRERLWPPLGSRVTIRQFGRDGETALQAIVVEAAADDSEPVLVRSRATIEVDGATHELDAWASARRVGCGTEWGSRSSSFGPTSVTGASLGAT